MINYGYASSIIDGTENKLDENFSSKLEIPLSYSYMEFLPSVLDQGSKPVCVPCSLAANFYWDQSINNSKDNFDIDYVFDSRPDKTMEGMSIKQALSFVKNYGFNPGKNKIKSYAMLTSVLVMQRSLIINGPFIIGLYVMDSNRSDFWNGFAFEGGHAVAVVGYNEEGFEIRNSWGSNYGNVGYFTLPYSDFGKIKEAWTIIV